MVKNTGNNHLIGSVNDRTQVKNPVHGNYTKRDTTTGLFIQQKHGGEPFKGVPKETDGWR